MGKHSARGSQEDRDPGSAEADSGPGAGRRRRSAGPGAQDPAVTPSQGIPRASYGPASPPARSRGGHPGPPGHPGHPGRREQTGGWSAFGTATMNAPQRPGGPAAGGAPGGGAGGLMPGPRKEYLEAFEGSEAPEAPDADGEDVFAAGAPGAVPPPRRTRPGAGADDDRENAGDAGEPGGPGALAADGIDDPDAPGKGARGVAKGGKGRTFTGVAAAAVTTVLAVVVAGQVANGPQSDSKAQSKGGPERGDGGGMSSRTDGRATPSASSGSPELATYSQKMAALYPLDPKLKGSGSFTTVPGQDKAPGKGQVLRYRVDVEKGLPLDGALFAEAVHKTLNDDRSWGHGGTRTFERVSSGRPDFVITLASPGTTAVWCQKSNLDTTEDNVSCDSASTERVMINAYRWAQGAKTFGDDKMHAYRQMLINHEVGHRLGHNHETCTKQGALAPVMMQQTKFLATDGVTCRPNAWPFPKG
ncbi:DUF3152 domain-containing protein [Streptomyces sp. NPDC021212]|uniref:DUF3152 domain-containing protein n=1 Tax=Streptomyces sp. NPDC021212 TaxID=3365118 RepID=UPI0037AD4ADC